MALTNKFRILFFLVGATIAGLSSAPSAQAFPQLTRHGYFNCTSCHWSPSGGGLLTSYGRGLSAELLSWMAAPGEEKEFWISQPSEKASFQGFAKGLQIFTDSSTAKTAMPILMQTDLQGAIRTGNFSWVASIGRDDDGDIQSRDHYLLLTQDKWNLRAGRFQPSYGLNHANHSLFIRNELGFGADWERYAIEGSYLAESFSVLATGILGSAQTISLNKTVGEFSRLGLSYLHDSADGTHRDVFGISGLVAYTEKLFSLFEWNEQWKTSPLDRHQKGSVFLHQLGYEFAQGWQPYLEIQYANLGDETSAKTGYGLGLDLFPRPHFHLEFFAGQEKLAHFDPTTIFYGMLGIYL